MINSLEELEQRVNEDAASAIDINDAKQKFRNEWDDMSPEVRTQMSNAIKAQVNVVKERVTKIFEEDHPQNILLLKMLYYARYGKKDQAILDYLIDKTNASYNSKHNHGG